jgi:hypothetical protein
MSSADEKDPKVKALLQRMEREHEQLISGVGLVTGVWATLEMSLFELFRLLARFATPPPGPDIAGVIFYTPTNTETRVSLVNNLIAYHCKMHSIGEIDERLVALWETKIKGKIDSFEKRKKRDSSRPDCNFFERHGSTHPTVACIWRYAANFSKHTSAQASRVGA